MLDKAALLGVLIVVKALEMPISSVREKLIIANLFSALMVVCRCRWFFFVEWVSNRSCWVSKIMREFDEFFFFFFVLAGEPNTAQIGCHSLARRPSYCTSYISLYGIIKRP